MAVAAALPAIEELNRLPIPQFAAALAPLFEGAPQFLARLAMARPFAGYADVWPAALRIARAMPEAEQIELIDAHPRLGAPPASVSAMSFREQGYDRETAETKAMAATKRLADELERLNAAYERRFGFRGRHLASVHDHPRGPTGQRRIAAGPEGARRLGPEHDRQQDRHAGSAGRHVDSKPDLAAAAAALGDGSGLAV